LICDRVAILDRGELRYCGEVSEIGQFVRSQKDQIDSTDPEIAEAQAEVGVTLELAGEEDRIRSALNGLRTNEFVKLSSGNQRVKISVFSQEEVDTAVDNLREQKISLVGLKREQATLEDAFLELLENKQGDK